MFMIILYLDDLASGVCTAVFAQKVRPLGRVTLRTLFGRHPIELPICGATAARLAAGSFPFEIRH
jgi:hypothetical protein